MRVSLILSAVCGVVAGLLFFRAGVWFEKVDYDLCMIQALTAATFLLLCLMYAQHDGMEFRKNQGKGKGTV